MKQKLKLFMYIALCFAMLVTIGLMTGCKGSDGSAGVSAPTTGTISGTVTSAVGSAALSGVAVTTSPVVSGATATTDASGNFTLTLPGGAYTVTLSKTGFTSGSQVVTVANGVQTVMSATMAQASSGAPTVTVAGANNPGYGQAFTVTASANSPVGGTLSYVWTGATGTGTTATGTSQTFTSAFAGIAAPSTDPGGFVSPFVQQNRFGILPTNADTRGAKSVSVKVTDNMGGSASASITINSVQVQSGLPQVALGIPVFMNAGTNNAVTWTATDPNGATVALSTTGTGTRNPWFVPTIQGKYVVSSASGSTINIYASKYFGAISGGTYTTKTVTEANGMWYTWAPSSTQSSMTFTNWPQVTPDSTCTGCHNGTIAPDNFTPWKDTVHATFWARGVENITGNGVTCTTCHTVGGSGGTNGYADLAASTTGYAYPAKQTGSWAAVWAAFPTVARVTNIQCENCHGPQQSTPGNGHSTAGPMGGNNATAPAAVRVSYSADVCGQCHSSGTGHHFFSEWNTVNPDTNKGHSKLAQLDVTGYTGHARSTNNSCVRCHTAQGFVAYLPQLLSGNAGTIPQAKITWTQDNAYPQTCVTCHDPHSDANDNQLRVMDSLPNTMAGFGVTGVGKGAVCMACHNNRNGVQCASTPTGTGLCTDGALSPTGLTFLHEDANTNGGTVGTASDPDTYMDSMHDAAQTEVLMGRDFFFMGDNLPMVSKHAAVEDTCVGCHMALNPSSHLSHGTPAINSHNFYIKDADRAKLCANCHSANVDGEGIVASVEAQLDDLATAMAADMRTRVGVSGATIYVNKTAVVLSTGPSGTTTVTYDDGTFYFNGTTVKGNLTNITTDAAGQVPVFAPNDKLKKASWNWTMIERDGSKGIHNPSLIMEVLRNTKAQF